MSLRARVVALIGLALIVGVLMASLSAGYVAKRTLHEELQAGMTGGEQTVASAFEDLRRSDHAERDLRQLVATFDGNRHVRATLTDGDGAALAASRRFEKVRAAPPWFAALLGPAPRPVRIAVPAPIRDRAIVLAPIADIDISAVWSELYVIGAALALSALAGLALAYLAIGAALRPLSALSAGFVRVGAGDYGDGVAAQGPPELLTLQRGFNDMVERLTTVSSRNRALEDQLLTLQDEERADLARDLHDEIGPHLFAINMDAAVAGQLVGTDRQGQITGHVRSIQASVAHMQRLVREILERLRPSRATELGLNAAILDLVAFWTARAPTIAIDCELLADETILDEPLKDTVYRIVQESLNNAVRHAAASRIVIRVRRLGEATVEVLVQDDGAPAPAPGNGKGGFGIIGMRERVKASGGVLTIDTGGARGGWSVNAGLPLHDMAAPAELDAVE